MILNSFIGLFSDGDRATSKEKKRSAVLKRNNHVSEEALKLHESRLALLAAGTILIAFLYKFALHSTKKKNTSQHILLVNG